MQQIFIKGKVIRGASYGRVLGFPTANIERRSYSQLKVKPKLGVWGGKVELKVKSEKLKVYLAAIVIGPFDKNKLPKIESHLIGFKGNLYNKHINIHLNSYIRPFMKFKSEGDLKSRIKKDINFIKSSYKK